jgi:hypothetical protein
MELNLAKVKSMETVVSVPVQKCKCSLKYCDLNCMLYCIFVWRPLKGTICEDCYWNDKELSNHDCITRKMNFEQQCLNILSSNESSQELYKIYKQQHDNKTFSSKDKFNYTTMKLVSEKLQELVCLLLNKDRSACKYYMWRGRYS